MDFTTLAFTEPKDANVAVLLSNGNVVFFSGYEALNKFVDLLDLENTDIEVVKTFVSDTAPPEPDDD